MVKETKDNKLKYADMPYLETEEEAAERLADFSEDGFNQNGFDKYVYKKTSGRIKTNEAKSFKNQKGKGYVNLPILLCKMYVNNSSKKLKNNTKQLLKALYDKKQISKLIYNNIIEAITYKNHS